MNVVIIGGGFAGAKAAQLLQKKCSVTLIDTKDYFEFTPSILRTIIKPSHAMSIQKCHKTYLNKATFVKGHVSEITKNEVYIGKKKIPFDHLIIATGSTYALPFKETDIIISTRAVHLEEKHKQLENAKNVLIIGGGLVGVEMAAEIAQAYPDKDVLLVHAHSRLMERQPIAASRYAEKFLKKHKVRIIYNDRVVKKNSQLMLKNANRAIATDITFLCTGIVCEDAHLKKHFSQQLTPKGQLKVDSCLRVCKNIYAAGDVTAIDEEKTAQNAEKQAKVVVDNILGKKKEYVASNRAMVVSLGPFDGIISYNNRTLTGFIPAFLKWAIEKKTMMRF